MFDKSSICCVSAKLHELFCTFNWQTLLCVPEQIRIGSVVYVYCSNYR